MSDILLRTPRATPLEYEDVDANFENINADKLQRTSNAGVTGTITSSATTSTITGLSSNNLAVGMVLVKTAGTGSLGTASTITAVDQFNDTITVVGSTSHTSGSITFTARPALTDAYIDAVSIGATTPGTGTFTTLNVTGNATFDTNTLFVDATNNAVGVGTVSPSNKFTVVGGSGDGIYYKDGTTNTYIGSGSGYGYIGTSTSHPLNIVVGNATAIYSDTSRNVGLSTVPSGTYKFEVSGNGYFSTALTVNTDLTVNGNTTLGNASGDTLTFQASTVSLPNGLNFDSNTLVIDASNNRVGIGTASPAVSLDVAGNMYIGGSSTSNFIAFRGTTGDGDGSYDHTYIGERIWGSTERSELLLFKGNDMGPADPGSDRIRAFAASFQVDTYTTNVGGASFETVASSANALKRFEIDNTGYAFGYPNGLSAGIIPAYQYFRLNSNLAGSNATGAQTMFGVGCSLVANTVYEFEISVNFRKSAGTTTHSFQLAFGGTRGVNNILYNVWGGSIQTTLNSVDTTAPTASIDTVNLTTITDAVGTASVASVQLLIKGTISVSTAGTFIPQYGLTAAPGGAYSTITGSYIKIWPVGASGANTSIGSWA